MQLPSDANEGDVMTYDGDEWKAKNIGFAQENIYITEED